MNIYSSEFPTYIKLSMLSFLILLCALSGIQGKAFPSRYRRDYEANYHYIPYEEGMVQLPEYSLEYLPSYHDYDHGYGQADGQDWSTFYHPPMPPQPMQDPYFKINTQQKMKEKHNWHFIDQNPDVPMTRYTDGSHQFESGVDAPNVIDSLAEKEVVDTHDGEYEAPIVVETLTRKNPIELHEDIPVILDTLTIKEQPNNYDYDKHIVVMDSPVENHQFVNEFKFPNSLTNEHKPLKSYDTYEPTKTILNAFELPAVESLNKKGNPTAFHVMPESIKDVPVASYAAKELLGVSDSLSKKQKPDNDESVAYYDMYKPVKEKPVKEKPVKEKPVKEKPVKEKPVKEKPVKEKPVKEKPEFLVEAEASNMEHDTPIVIEALIRKENPTFQSQEDYDIPVVEEALVRKMFLAKDASVVSNDAFEIPFKMSSLTKKEKPDKVKPASSHYMYDAGKDNFELPIEPDSSNMEPDYDTPIVSEALIRKEKLTLQTQDYDKPVVVEALVRKLPLTKDSPAVSYDSFELPVASDNLSKTDKTIKNSPVVSYGAVERNSLTKKEKPEKVKPVASYDEYESLKDAPVVPHDGVEMNSSNMEYEYDTPIVIEALTRKENPTVQTDDDYDTPVVVEALVRKIPVYENTETKPKAEKISPKDLFLPGKDSIITKEDVVKFDIPVVETLGLEDESEESSIHERIEFDGAQNFHTEPEMEELNVNEDIGSGMDLDGSTLAREFPLNNIFSMATTIQDQERQKFKSCVTPKNETGNCMPFQLCSISNTLRNIDELLRNVCVIDEVFIGVCCPEFPVETVRVVWEQLKPDSEMLNNKESSDSKECGRLPSMITDKDPWPWMASLIAKSSDKTFCGGALISEQYAITAAHCTIRIPRNQILVRLGRPASENRAEPDFEVVEIKRHAGYNPRTMQNDIALLKLSRRVKLGGFRRVVCIAENVEKGGLIGERANLLHWKDTPGEIGDVESLSVISNQECQSKMRTAIADSILCTGPRADEAMCNADSGAPLIIAKNDTFEVIGILTWNRNDCDERFPTVFTRMSSYRRWIEKHSS